MGRADANFNFASVGIAGALPWGILLALGRAPICRLCVSYRSFLSSSGAATADYRIVYVFGHAAFVYGRSTSIDKLIRALVGVILFQSAMLRKSCEADYRHCLKGSMKRRVAGVGLLENSGAGYSATGVKLVIPGLVNTIIALFKDTSW